MPSLPAPTPAQPLPAAGVSVVIRARDAEATLAETLDSVVAQTAADWEALVIDDWSRDSTASVAREYARRDPRVRLVADTGGRGPSAARNRGLAEARFDQTLFLDADDILAPNALRALSAALGDDPGITAAHGAWRRFSQEHGELAPEHGPGDEDLFPHFGRRPTLIMHSCLVRTDTVRTAGGFDESLPVVEDWDLWQRLARAGARFAAVPEVVSRYRVRGGSLSSDPRGLIRQGLAVIRRAHAPDSRVPSPSPAWAGGLPGDEAVEAQTAFVVWAAGALLGRGEDPAPLLEDTPPGARGLDPENVARTIAEAAPLAAGRAPAAWTELWAAAEPLVDPFLKALESVSQTRMLAERTRRQLEAAVACRVARAARVGRAHGVRIEATERPADVHLPASAERLIVTVTAEHEPLGTVTLPVCDGVVPGEVLADAVADRFWWTLLERFLRATVYHGEVDHDAVGWEVFLQELWGLPGKPAGDFYAPPSRQPGRLARLRPVTLGFEVSDWPPEVPRGPADLLLVAGVGGRAIGMVRCTHRTSDGMRMAVTEACGTELCRAAVREGVIGRPFAAPESLRARLAERAAAGWDAARGLVLGRHAAGPIGTSSSRLARLPSEAGGEAAAAARAAGEPVEGPEGGKVSYAPDRVWAPEPQAAAELRPANERLEAGPPSTSALPILMYHRVDDSGGRWSVPPAVFAEQLSYLADAGYHTVTFDDWRRAADRLVPLPGRAVILTFDDGYRDFADNAWPALDRHGFGATAFVVTDHVGGANAWDEGHEAPTPLLSWDEIRDLHRAGVEFGSHTAGHPHLMARTPAEVVREAARSRLALTEQLGRPPTAFAYPFGDHDPAVAHLVGACGFAYGVTVRSARATRHDRLLELPRIEVADEDLERFVARLSPDPAF